jgi:hypothetical protein
VGGRSRRLGRDRARLDPRRMPTRWTFLGR